VTIWPTVQVRLFGCAVMVGDAVVAEPLEEDVNGAREVGLLEGFAVPDVPPGVAVCEPDVAVGVRSVLAPGVDAPDGLAPRVALGVPDLLAPGVLGGW
jgi:hypothetical protein